MLVSGMILSLYFWVFFSGAATVSSVLFVHDYAALAAGAVFIVATVSHLWSPRRHLFRTALVSYTLLLAMIVILITNTGLVSSPFVALWMIAAIFGSIFGWYGVAIVAAMVMSFIGYVWSIEGLGLYTLLTVLFVSILSVAVGMIGFRPSSRAADTEDRAYHELATELSEASSKAEIVISAIADGVVAADQDGIIQLINPAAQKMIGWGHKDALGLSIASVINLVDDRDQPVSDLNSPVQQALKTNEPAQSEHFSLLTADTGKKFLASITASPLGREGSGIIVVFRDITNERAEEREQAEFISTASHEMRTPVASIEGYLGLALNPNTAQIDARARDYIMKAHDSAQHLGRLFQDLLDVSKADDGRLNNDPHVIDVVPFFRDIIIGFSTKATEKQLTVNYKPMPNLDIVNNTEKGDRTVPQILYVHVDRDHLREVLANLTENAIKYTLTGSITIDVTGTNQHVTVSVTDTGIGIPKEDLGHLFQKFYRVDNTDTREIGGTGLGLYLCRRLTEAMGGKIWVESTYQQGSTFFVRLPRISYDEAKPLLEEEALREAQRQESNAAQNRTKIEINHEPTIPEPEAPEESTPIEVAPHPDEKPEPPGQQEAAPPQNPPEPVAANDTPRPQLSELAPQPPNVTLPRQQVASENALIEGIERSPAQHAPEDTSLPPSRMPPRYNR